MPALTNKKIILTFIGHYLPGYKAGGPVRTISNMLNLLSGEYEFKIITRDRDLLENKTYPNILINQWNSLENCRVFYHDLKYSLRKIINNSSFDLYYLNSLFDYHFSIKVVLLHKLGLIPKKKIIIAPRGELLEGALSTKSLKKKLFLLLAKTSGMYKDVIWHASSLFEESVIKQEFGNNIRTKVALDIPCFNLSTKTERTHQKQAGKLKILFISRIAKTKNLKFVIEVLNKVQGDFTLDIYGPIVDKEYWNECQEAIDERIRKRIVYKGIISNDQISDIYPNYDLLFFPTLGESFGHVIFESLVYGCPVLSSDKTPWNKLQKYHAGWTYDLNERQKYIYILDKLVTIDKNSYKKYLTGCENYIKEFETEKDVIENNLLLFKV